MPLRLIVSRFGALLLPALAALLLGLPANVAAQTPREDLLVDAAWLQARLASGEPVALLHVASGGDEGEPAAIPGSAVITLDMISVNRPDEAPPVRLDLPAELGEVRRVFQEAGISDDSRVVVTYAGRRFPDATRAVWTLQFLGKDRGVSILNGGVEAWEAAGGELTTERTPVGPGRITAAPRVDRRVDAAYVLATSSRPGTALVDARRTASWDGSRPELPGRAGHVPGAGSLPQVDLYTEDGLLKPAGELQDLFALAGVDPGDEVVAYCHIGYWASAVVFAARTLGLDARLYDGSMTEWAARGELPLVLPPDVP